MGDKKKPGRIKSALLDWLGVPIGLNDGAFWQEWFGTSASGKHVTVDKALQLSTVWGLCAPAVGVGVDAAAQALPALA